MNASSFAHPMSGAGETPGATAGRSWWSGLAGAIVREYRLRRAVRELAVMDDHILRDIGLGRGELERAARFGRR